MDASINKPLVVIVDTNTFLHYQAFEQIRWEKVFGVPSVLLLLPLTVVEELDRHKENHAVAHIRERAQKALSKIRAAVFEKQGRLTSSTQVECGSALSSTDVTSFGLDPAVADDRILAALMQYQSIDPNRDVRLVTSDAGLALKAHGRGIRTTALPDKLRIQPSTDKKTQQIRALEAQLREVQQIGPRLTVTFADSGIRQVIRLERPKATSLEFARQYVYANVAPHYRKRETSEFAGKMALLKGETNAPDEIQKMMVGLVATWQHTSAISHNAELDAYFEALAQYYYRLGLHQDRLGLIRSFNLMVSNDGTAPAEDINLFVRFPRSIQLSGDLPPVPLPPAPPKGHLGAVQQPAPPAISGATPAGFSFVDQRTTDEFHELRLQFSKLNHHVFALVPTLWVHFPAYDTAQSFRVDYWVASANSGAKVEGELHVNVERDQIPVRRRLARGK